MQFELTEALVNGILFSMEDQEYKFFIDTKKAEVAGGAEFDLNKITGDEENRFIDLPEWVPSDGYRMMEHFTANLKNKEIQDELNAALKRGKGVFRAFKDVLSRNPEIEKLWFLHKERTMKHRIINWYNGLRDEWGLEKIGGEPEETGDLVLEDFRFRPFREEDKKYALDLHDFCKKENPLLNFDKFSEPEKKDFPGNPAWTAESGNGEFAGFLGAMHKENFFFIEYLEVKSEYRGLGLAESLIEHFLAEIKLHKQNKSVKQNQIAVFLELPASSEGFSRVLLRENFNPCITCYKLNL